MRQGTCWQWSSPDEKENEGTQRQKPKKEAGGRGQ